MIEVRNPKRFAALRHFCLDQPATAAPHLIVAFAQPDRWCLVRTLMFDRIERKKAVPALPVTLQEFLPHFEPQCRLLIPFLCEDGPFRLFVSLKRLVIRWQCWSRPTMRLPFGRIAQLNAAM